MRESLKLGNQLTVFVEDPVFGGLQASPEAVGPDRPALLRLGGARGLSWAAGPPVPPGSLLGPLLRHPGVFFSFFLSLLFEKIFLQISEHFVKVLWSVYFLH